MATIMTRIFLTTAIVLCLFYLAINQLSINVQMKFPEKSSIDSVRICCLILTAPKYFNTRTRAVNATWAPRCDKYLFISEYSNQTNSSFPIAPIRNLSTGYSHLTKKTTLAFHYAYENLFEQFDWFVKADDDTYLIMENLRYFLQQQNSSEPITFGYNFKVNFTPKTFQSFFFQTLVPRGYHSGGAAYVLSREALRRFYQAHHENNSTCLVDGGRGEDVEIADCLRKKNVYPGKSIDHLHRERFHPLPFSSHYLGKFPKWLQKSAENKLSNVS